tara:strand:- start:240 stop:449 length:210 start_codon:yes stop_codon:yes gene_type:complete
MKLIVNGQKKELKLKTNSPKLDEIIELLGYDSRLIVVEFNGIILPSSKWSIQNVKDRDSLEIVTIVGGG